MSLVSFILFLKNQPYPPFSRNTLWTRTNSLPSYLQPLEQAPRSQRPGLQTVHIFTQRNFVADFFNMILHGKRPFRVYSPLCGVRGYVQCSYSAYWKARRSIQRQREDILCTSMNDNENQPNNVVIRIQNLHYTKHVILHHNAYTISKYSSQRNNWCNFYMLQIHSALDIFFKLVFFVLFPTLFQFLRSVDFVKFRLSTS